MKPHRTLFSISFVLSAILLVIAGCRTVTSPNIGTQGVPITTTIAGRVTDESGVPVAGVAISGQAASVMTDANGLFFIPNTTVPSNRTFILAKKAGYFDGARAAIPTANGVTYMQITLASNTSIGTIDAASGGSVTLPTGGSLSLVAGGVVTSSGTAYSGPVSISAEHLDPGNGNFANLFAGDLTGQQVDNSQTELQSYGVIVAELHGSNGETLQPAPGAPATLTLPIAAAQQAAAPPTISLWYFDESLGMWQERGSAYKQGNNYVGTVPHFCQWNYDQQVPYGTLTGTIVCNDVPIPGVVVNLGAYVEGGQPYVVTDGNGRFTVRVPANSNKVVLQVLSSENNGVYWTKNPIVENIPANVTTDVGQIALSSPCPSYLQGTIKDCGNAPTAGMVLASWSGGMSYVYTTTGQYRLTAPSGLTVTLAATAASGSAAQPQTMTAGSEGAFVNAPDLVACSSTSDVLNDITGSFNGSVLAFSPDGTKLAVAASNGLDVDILDVASGNQVAQLKNAFSYPLRMPPIQYGESGSVGFSADGATLLTQESYQGFNIWHSDGTRVTPNTVSALSACLSPDGLSVIGTDYAHGVFQYTIATGSFMTMSSAKGSAIVGLASGGSQYISIAGNTGYRWDIASNTQVTSFTIPASSGIDSSQQNSRISPDGNVLGLTSNSITFLNTQSGATLNSGNIQTSYGGSYGIAPDDSHFIAQYQSAGANTVGLFNISDGTPYHLFDAPASLGTSSGVAISPDGKRAAAAYANEVRVWKVQ